MVFAAVCETLNRYRFFRRFVPAMRNRGDEILFLSNRLSIVIAAKKDGFSSYLICESVADIKFNGEECENISELKGVLSDFDEKSLYSRINSFLSRLFLEKKIDCFLFWNGSSFLCHSIKNIISQYGCKSLYFEIGNFPGKIFVDPCGVNSQSWYAENHSDLDFSEFDHEKFDSWRHSYLEKKMLSHMVPQANASTTFNWLYPLDLVGIYIFSAIFTEKPDVFRRTWNYVRSRNVEYEYDNFNPEVTKDYIFFPMQVSTDSQLLFNSDVDNIGALKIAAEIAKKENRILVVKPHPAEGDRVFVNRLLKMKDEIGFIFVDYNTYGLINNCHRVVTINSTVGIEAMLFKRPVTVLGRAFYRDFTMKDLGYYIQCHLIDVDFFAKNPLSEIELHQILNRLNFSTAHTPLK